MATEISNDIGEVIMMKSSFALLLVAISSAAYADWRSVNAGSTTATYIDLATRQKSGKTVKMWHLNDEHTPKAVEGGKTFSSLKAQIEYDCVERNYQYLWTTVYSGHMGTGDVLDSLSGNKIWRPVIPGTVWEIMWNAACLSNK